MTLSAIGDAETPAGGSVCIRYDREFLAQAQIPAPFFALEDKHRLQYVGAENLLGAQYFEITHEASARRCSHSVGWTLDLKLDLGDNGKVVKLL